MFRKRKKVDGATTVIAVGTVIEGLIRVRGMVQVDGTIEGTMLAEGHVSVGPEGRIVGEVTAEQISVGGTIEGMVSTRGHLHVLATGSVRGTARYASLEIERGGVMDGNASRLRSEADNDQDVVAMSADDAELVQHAAAE